MKELQRRKFIKMVAAAMAAGLSGAVTESCTSLKAGYLAGAGRERDVSTVLEHLDRNCTVIRKRSIMRRSKRLYSKLNCKTDIVPDALETLLVAGMFGDLGEGERKHPAVQRRMRRALPVMTDAFTGMATYLESQTKEERDELRTFLREQPEILTEFQVAFEIEAQKNDVPPERMKHLHSIFNQCVWRLKNQDPSAVIDECVAMINKTGSVHGMTPEKRREFAAAGGFQNMSVYDEAGPAATASDASGTDENTDSTTQIIKNRLLREDGRRMVGVGGALMGIGTIAFGTGVFGSFSTLDTPAFLLFVIFGCIGGAICLVAGLIVMLVGLSKLIRAKDGRN